MFKYHCLNPISKVGTDKFTNNYVKTDNIEEADGILVRSAAMHDMELPKGLLAVARAGAGVNNIPLDKCANQGIVVFNTPGANANGVKELVIAGMLLAAPIFSVQAILMRLPQNLALQAYTSFRLTRWLQTTATKVLSNCTAKLILTNFQMKSSKKSSTKNAYLHAFRPKTRLES